MDFILCFLLLHVQNHVLLDVKNYTYYFNEKYVNLSCDIRGSNFNCFIQSFKPLDKIEFFVSIRALGFDLYKKLLNFCGFLKNQRSDLIFGYLYQELYKHGLKVDKCPAEPVNTNLKLFFDTFIFIQNFSKFQFTVHI